jgi:hypothetical protein
MQTRDIALCINVSNCSSQLHGFSLKVMPDSFSDVFRSILDSPYYVFVALCIVIIVVSLIKIAASNENIGYRAPDPSFFKSSCTGQDKK